MRIIDWTLQGFQKLHDTDILQLWMLHLNTTRTTKFSVNNDNDTIFIKKSPYREMITTIWGGVCGAVLRVSITKSTTSGTKQQFKWSIKLTSHYIINTSDHKMIINSLKKDMTEEVYQREWSSNADTLLNHLSQAFQKRVEQPFVSLCVLENLMDMNDVW
jgi:hypothetical protein